MSEGWMHQRIDEARTCKEKTKERKAKMQARRQWFMTLAAFAVMVFVMTLVNAHADTYYVKITGSDVNGGTSWADAWKTVTHALANTPAGSNIYVRAGVYNTAHGETFPLIVDNTNNDTLVRGGGVGVTVIDAGGGSRVLSISGVTGFDLEALTITGGSVTSNNSADFGGANGGGIYCYNSTDVHFNEIEVSNCYAKGSYAAKHGEGSGVNWGSQSPPALAGGGGIYLRYCKSGSEPTVFLHNCLIRGNTTGMGGGGVCSNYAPAIYTDCCIYDNSGSRGGGMYWFDYVVNGAKIEHLLFNDLIVQNSIGDAAYGSNGGGTLGGGLYMSNWGIDQKYRIYSTTVADNDGFEVYLDNTCQNADIKGGNDIFWPDEDNLGFYDDGFAGTADFTYSDIWWQDGSTAYPGTGNIVSDPLFVAYDSTPSMSYFLDHVTPSPAVDTGSNGLRKATEIITPNPYTTNITGVYDGNDSKPIDMGYHSRTNNPSYIELESFGAKATPDSVVLTWETASEVNNAGFVLYRTLAGETNYEMISGLIEAEGNTSTGASYNFEDCSVNSGKTYVYWLVDIDTSGEWTAHGPVSATVPMLMFVDRPISQLAVR